MKKLFFAVAAIAAMISVSCVTEQSGNTDAGKKVSISVKLAAPGGATRADENAAQSNQITIANGYIYVLDGSSVNYSEPFNALTTGDEITLDGGKKSFPSTSTVFVLANVPSNLTISPASLSSMDDIKNAVSEIVYSASGGVNVDYKTPAMGNIGAAVAVIPDASDATVSTAKLDISPLYARVQIQGLKGGKDAEGNTWIKDFKLANVYIDNYYSKFSMTGVGSDLQSAGQNTNTLDSQFGDPVNMTSAANTISPTNGVWAYHVGPGSLVHVIFKLSEYTAYNKKADGSPDTAFTTTSTPTYLTVNSYLQSSVTEFQRGKVYTISPVVFSKKGQATDEPNTTDVSIAATITVTDWIPQGLDGVVVEEE